MSRRFQIVLPTPLAAELEALAQSSGEPPSTLAARIVRAGLVTTAKRGGFKPDGTVSARAPRSREPPPWVEPHANGPAWRREMWASILALHARYARLLEALKDGWWADEAQTEMLCALAVWRAEIDDAGESPREELAFHRELADFAESLRRQGGGVAATWIPGAPPDEWLAQS